MGSNMALRLSLRSGHCSQPQRLTLSFRRNIGSTNTLIQQQVRASAVSRAAGLQVYAVTGRVSQKKRERQHAANRLVNKERKAKLRTQTRLINQLGKAFMLPENLQKIKEESDIKTLDEEISKAHSILDRAKNKGTFHYKTCDRKKKKLSLLRQRVLMAAGLYVPQVEQKLV
eukprot:TRINITY_DN111_c0_g1_i7.p1 TRINITY_DN111_c0_g1~~TRINITY_DN111_c0_g1_i7.p1  ORF type:complete len:172 (-),score=14.82 TRINITY_DN111_c0_g1_i7:103-618(-)